MTVATMPIGVRVHNIQPTRILEILTECGGSVVLAFYDPEVAMKIAYEATQIARHLQEYEAASQELCGEGRR